MSSQLPRGAHPQHHELCSQTQPHPACLERSPQRPLLRCWIPGAIALFSSLLALQLFFSAHQTTPVPAYGADGAELLTHLQRLHATRALDATPGAFSGPFALLRRLDGHYPPLLHLLTAQVYAALGWSDDDLAAAVLPNLGWLSLLALAVASLAARGWPAQEADPIEPPRSPGTGLLAFAVTLLVPGLALPARRYYYDLPMVALCCATIALFVHAAHASQPWQRVARGALAGLTFAMAMLMRWAAALYLLPLWLVWAGLEVQRVHSRRSLSGLLACFLTLAVALGGVLPLAVKPEGSFGFQLALGMGGEGPEPTSQAGANALWFYLNALATAGLGPILTSLLLPALLLELSASDGRRRLLPLCFGGGVPLIWLCLKVPALDGRYLMPLLPLLILLLVGVWRRLDARWQPAWLMLVGLAALAQTPWAERQPSPDLEHQPWRRWWWSGGAADLPSRWHEERPVLEQLLEQFRGLTPAREEAASELRVLVIGSLEHPAPIPVWQFGLELLLPGRSSLVATPALADPVQQLLALDSQVDLMVVYGGAQAAERHPFLSSPRLAESFSGPHAAPNHPEPTCFVRRGHR